MSGSGIEELPGNVRNPNPPSFGRQSSAPALGQSAAPSSSSFEPSPSAPYPPNPTCIAPESNQHTVRLHDTEGTLHLHANGRPSPEPDEFYRHGSQVAATDSHIGLDDVTAATMAIGQGDLTDRVSPLPTETLSLARGRPLAYRSTSDSPLARGLSSTVPASSSARARQPSFKDLVNRFNKTSDDILPLPSVSRTPSRTASPSGGFEGDPQSRSLPRRRYTRGESPTLEHIPSETTQHIDLARPATKIELSALDSFALDTVVAPPPLSQRIPKSHPRRPLFGELLSVNTQFNNLGLGIPPHIQRRGSEGSLPSPNPAFLEQSHLLEARSPLTPTAWYRGETSSLEAVQPVTNGTVSYHRRVRSDFSANPSREPLADPFMPEMAVAAPLRQTKPGEKSPGSPNSRSRIPVSSARLPSAAGSRSHSPTSNSTFSKRSSAIPLAPKGSSRLPKPSGIDSPPRLAAMGPGSFATTPRGRRETTIGRTRTQIPEQGQRLQAYIAAPPPTKSPPLRSSRPRQPVSHGGPTSPRSRIEDRISTLQRQTGRDHDSNRSPRIRSRRFAELGNVDFESRRQRIQQAFTRTVQENERKEEAAAQLRRKARDQEQQTAVHGDDANTPVDEQATTPHAQVADHTSLELPEMATAIAAQSLSVSAGGEQATVVPKLRLDTSMDPSQENGPHTTMDSPTLGIVDEPYDSTRSQQGRNREYDLEPNSAISATSSGTHVTQFDPEPQFGLLERKPSLSNRTLLNQIMQIRESSSSSESCDEPDCSLSETDEKASIQIMLHETPTLHSTGSGNTEEASSVPLQAGQAMDHIQHRWSMSSWDSSMQTNQLSTCDEHCDDSGDDAAFQDDQAVDVLTQSCSATSTSAASLDDHEHTASPINSDIGMMGPDTVESVQQKRYSRAFSTAPNLVKQGRWDSRRVTQLYLEELTRGGSSHQGSKPNTGNSADNQRTAAIGNPAVPHPSRAHGYTASPADDHVMVPMYRESPVMGNTPGLHEDSRPAVQPSEQYHPSATLAGPSDWEHASPSIMDWMQVAAEDDVPTPGVERDFSDDLLTPRQHKAPVELEASTCYDSGLGLSFGASSSARELVELPTSTPHDGSDQTTKRKTLPENSSLTTTHSIRSSQDSSFPLADSTSSPRAPDSSATSLAPSAEQSMREEPRKTPSPEQKQLKKRRNIIKELIDTEYTFGKDMKVVDDIYKGTSSSCLDLSAEDVKILFANSDQITQFSFNFQDTLKRAARSVYIMPKSQRWSSKRSARNARSATTSEDQAGSDAGTSDLEKDRSTAIGEAFMIHMSQMEKVYSEYLKNHDAANKKLEVLQRNPKVSIWLNECREWASDLTSAWDLDSLIVKPVQRILKYPLLLSELLASTSPDHPDRASIQNALQGVTDISVRINEMKKRADLVVQVVGRKRNQSDLRQQVGISEMFSDKEYDYLSQKFGEHFAELHVIKNDVLVYKEGMQRSVAQLGACVQAIEGVIDVSQSSYPDLERKWRRFNHTFQEIVTVALPEHLEMVTKRIHGPFDSIICLYQGPERVMRKRNKRLPDYARFKAAKDRGDKPDKKSTEQGEQFMALNETLKEELPQLFALTGKLMEAILTDLIKLQTTWWSQLQARLEEHVDNFPDDVGRLVNEWTNENSFAEAQVLSLGVCNGSLLAETVNLMNFNTSSNLNSPRRPSTMNSFNGRPGSLTEESPKLSSDFSMGQLFQSPNMSMTSVTRHRADSAFSGRAPYSETPDLGRSQLLQQVTNTSRSSSDIRSSIEPFPSLPSLSLDAPFLTDVMNVSKLDAEPQPNSPTDRFSGFFSSAMPMSDNPQEPEAPRAPRGLAEGAKVLFVAASLCPFKIDPRSEAGYPYLIYDTGAVFDVYGEKGELWLACNQDENLDAPGMDSHGRRQENERTVGWIWSRHFVKLA
ncbi:hypothetical protein N7539_002969 [Penicillium diatomitis]|uniref:DH domain-containing protein n=1 Tax=Penicillium diatomitis TaxID=2819901 RepID=A0A9W9XFW7_9EURO|nr:uncharacterized protein N7539_002969 [Penicillium diatomitis]KAJ5491402.1 hypothetical protein N7539_002969 [Penicillium diatomitis]